LAFLFLSDKLIKIYHLKTKNLMNHGIRQRSWSMSSAQLLPLVPRLQARRPPPLLARRPPPPPGPNPPPPPVNNAIPPVPGPVAAPPPLQNQPAAQNQPNLPNRLQ